MSSYADAAAIRRDVARLIKPPRRLPISQAVAESMMVVQGDGSRALWSPTRTPYMIEPMDCMGMRSLKSVVFVGPARTGKSLALIDGYIAHKVLNDPGDGLLVQITEVKAAQHSKKRLSRMFDSSPQLAACLSPRGHDNNVHEKIFKAGNYLAIQWPSKNVFASSDYQFVLLTDYDRMSQDIGGEGSPFILASKRTETFGSSGMTMAESSPGRLVIDPDWRQPKDHPHMAPPTTGILSLYNEGDRRKLYWQCLEKTCRHWFTPTMDHFHLEGAFVFCPECGREFKPGEKQTLNNSHRWLPEGCELDEKGVIHGEGRDNGKASFWMEGPAAGYQTWTSLRDKLLAAERTFEETGDQEDLKGVTNTDLGRPYVSRIAAKRRSSSRLQDRAERIDHRTVPPGVRFLIATVDVQGGKDRRFVVQIHGFGVDREAWLIDRFNISEDRGPDNDQEPRQVSPATRPEDWDLLTRDVLHRSYKLSDASGRRMPVLALGVDTGGEGKGAESVTSQAYTWYRKIARLGLSDRVFLLKGASTSSPNRVRRTLPDNTSRKQRNADARGDVPLYLVTTDAMKDMVFAMTDREDFGAGYMHVPDWVPSWWYDELTCEVKDPKTGKYVRPGKKPNEALDLWVYALTIFILLKGEKINWSRPPAWAADWDENTMIFSRDEGTPELTPPPIVKRKKRAPRRRRVVKPKL